MFTAAKFVKPSLFYLILLLALTGPADPALAAPGEAETAMIPDRRPAHIRALDYDHRTAPKTVTLLGRFNAADHQSKRRPPRPGEPHHGLFFDLEREVEVDLDVWYGKAGVEFNW